MSTRAVLFDLGGVLVRLGGVEEFGDLIGEHREDEIWRVWLECPWVRRFERGRCTSEESARGMVERHGLEIGPAEFLDLFRRWPQGLLPEAEELVQSLRADLRRACLTNTNPLHWQEQRDGARIRSLFELSLTSHEIGHVKPDREIFEHTLRALGCAPPEVLFLDDNQINVDGALEVGLDAHRAVGTEDARRILSERGLLL